MEYGINLKIKAKKKYSDLLNRFVESAISGDIDNLEEIFVALGDDALEKYTNIKTHEYYGSYIDYIQDCPIDKKNGKTTIYITTGGWGPEFSVALVDLLGEYCEEITADMTHDEDYGHIPVKLTYAKATVYEDGKEIALRTFDDHNEIDSWEEEPIVEKDTLASIYNICKKATVDTSFSQLTEIYIDLYDPIVFEARTHSLLTAALDGDDKEEYKEDIEEVLNSKYYKNNHLVFTFFKNKMYENLQEMSKTTYLGSIFLEYKKTLMTFYAIYDAIDEESEGTFEELFEDVNEQDDFDIVYEITVLYDIDGLLESNLPEVSQLAQEFDYGGKHFSNKTALVRLLVPDTERRSTLHEFWQNFCNFNKNEPLNTIVKEFSKQTIKSKKTEAEWCRYKYSDESWNIGPENIIYNIKSVVTREQSIYICFDIDGLDVMRGIHDYLEDGHADYDIFEYDDYDVFDDQFSALLTVFQRMRGVKKAWLKIRPEIDSKMELTSFWPMPDYDVPELIDTLTKNENDWLN